MFFLLLMGEKKMNLSGKCMGMQQVLRLPTSSWRSNLGCSTIISPATYVDKKFDVPFLNQEV